MGKLESNLYPEMNVFLGKLEMTLLDLIDLEVLPKKDLNFFLFSLNEATKMQTIEHLGAHKFFLVSEKRVEKKCLRAVAVKVVSLYDDCVGVSSEFGDPKIDQAISVLWLVVRNYVKSHPEDHQENDSFWKRIIEEAGLLEKIFELKNPCICEICKMILKNKKRLILN